MGNGLPRSFADHPRSVGETYGEHFQIAVGFGLRLIAAGLACLVHAAIPAWFTRSGSRAVGALARELEERTRRADYALRTEPPCESSADTGSAGASLQSRSRS